MGLPGIVAIMSAMAVSRSMGGGRISPKDNSGWAQPNKYADQYREQIIRNVIRQARPSIFGWFDICPVNNAAKVLNVKYMGSDAYRLLGAYHCVGYWFIPRAIRKRIPEFIREALTAAPPSQEGK